MESTGTATFFFFFLLFVEALLAEDLPDEEDADDLPLCTGAFELYDDAPDEGLELLTPERAAELLPDPVFFIFFLVSQKDIFPLLLMKIIYLTQMKVSSINRAKITQKNRSSRHRFCQIKGIHKGSARPVWISPFVENDRH